MTKLEIERKFKKAGWKIVHGKAHDLAVSPTGQKVPIPPIVLYYIIIR